MAAGVAWVPADTDARVGDPDRVSLAVYPNADTAGGYDGARMLLETGDGMLLETGDTILLEA